MPNHDLNHPKPIPLPKDPKEIGHIIGYTGELLELPTVYFTNGHYTQSHKEKWDVGWESCNGWTLKFFGNVKSGAHGGNTGTVDDYIKLLRAHLDGNKNRVNNSGYESLGPDGIKGMHHLREFWVRGDDKEKEKEENRFAHPSRNLFIPVARGEVAKIKQLNDQLENVRTQPESLLEKVSWTKGAVTEWKIGKKQPRTPPPAPSKKPITTR